MKVTTSIATGAFLFSSPANAADALPRVNVELSGCGASLTSEVQRIAAIELRAAVVDTTTQQAITRVIVTCRENVADLWVSDSTTSKLLERTVALTDAAPRARARLLALAVAELVSASWEELESNPRPQVPPASSPRTDMAPLVRRSLERTPRLFADAVFDGRFFGNFSAPLFGGGVRVAGNLTHGLLLRVDALADFGTISRTLGGVSVEMFGGGVGLGWGLDWGVTDAMGWLGARGGYARLVGVPTDAALGRVQNGAWLGPELGAELVLFPRAAAHVTLGASAGYAALGVRGHVDGESDVQIYGLWGGFMIGVGLSKR